MSGNNPYQAPASNLEVPNQSSHELNPDWTIENVMNEAWQLTKGFKGSFWGALIIYIVIAAILGGITEFIAGTSVALIYCYFCNCSGQYDSVGYWFNLEFAFW
ncbi:MAG: hypothetical protein IPK77_15430 [Cellvibrio sp.]|nr:hypothetical protein [Cellvibrio sp.]